MWGGRSRFVVLLLLLAVVWITIAPDVDLDPVALRFRNIAKLFWSVLTAALAVISMLARHLNDAICPWEQNPSQSSPPLTDLVCTRLC